MTSNQEFEFNKLFKMFGTLYWFDGEAWVPRIHKLTQGTAAALISGAGNLDFEEVQEKIEAKKEEPLW